MKTGSILSFFLLLGASATALFASPSRSVSTQVQAPSAEEWARFERRLNGSFEHRTDQNSAAAAATLEARGRIALPFDAASGEPQLGEAIAAIEQLLGSPSKSLVEVRHAALAGMHSYQFEQRLDGLSVIDSRVELRVVQSSLTLLRASGLVVAAPAPTAVLERGDALELARIAMPAADTSRLWAKSKGQALLWTVDRGLRPVWQVDVWDPMSALSVWSVVVDALDGQLLRTTSGVLEGVSGTVDGRGMLTGPQTMGAPAVMPMANVYVTAVDSLAAALRITDDGCIQTEVAISADSTRIAWVSTCDGDSELWTSKADGTMKVQLTSNFDEDHSPSLSDDGSKLFFASDRDGDLELYSMSTDGSALVQLTSNSLADHSPSASGDGSRLVYVRGQGVGAEIFTLLTAAPTPVQLSSNSKLDEKPRISRDGSRVAWVSWVDGDAEIMCMNPSGGAAVQITVNDVLDTDPDLLADGSKVIFASRLAYDLQNGGDPSAIIPAGSHRLSPRQQFDIFEANTDGTSLERRTFSDADEVSPSYATGGGCVVFVTSTAAVSDLVALDLTTNSTLKLTNDLTADRGPRVASTCANGVWIANDGDPEVFAWNLGAPGDFVTGKTNLAGAYSLPVPDATSPSVYADLTGSWVKIADLDPKSLSVDAFASATAPAANVDLHFNSSGFVEGPTAQVTAYAHLERAHSELDKILRRPPLSMVGALAIDTQLLARVNFPLATPNAYYSPVLDEATFFIGDGPTRPNTAYDSLAYHEYGHFLDDMDGGIAPGSVCEAPFALSEGIGDALAVYLSASPVVGAGFFGAGTWIRNYAVFPWSAPGGEKGRQYGCEDCPMVSGKPEAHEHGAAFAGFAWDLRSSLGAITAEDLIFGAIFSNPPDMQAAVYEVFSLAATPAFGGSGDPATSPLALPICTAAAKHGFDCPLNADHGSWGCSLASLCGPFPARHRVIRTEWLGTFVDAEGSCEPAPNFDDDGVVVPPHLGEGTLPPISVTMRVNPALKGSGRYGAPLPHPQLEPRRVFLNGWLFIDNGIGGFDPYKVFGHGTPTGILAYNPDTWVGDSKTVPLTFTVPMVPVDRLAILRVRFDYGEDGGRLTDNCMSDPTYAGACGLARFGEVEDYQVAVLNSVP